MSVALDPALPGHDDFFDPSHEEVEAIGDNADHDDAHDDNSGLKELRRVRRSDYLGNVDQAVSTG